MSQLSFLDEEIDAAVKGCAERFALCRDRVAQGCGGHHAPGQIFAGLPVSRWICCADCPVRSEVASAIAEDAAE